MGGGISDNENPDGDTMQTKFKFKSVNSLHSH